MSEKSQIRSQMRARLLACSADDLEQAGRAALLNLDALPEWRDSSPESAPARRASCALGAFISGPREISTGPLLRRALGRGWRVAVPAWHSGHRLYRLAWLDEDEGMREGPHGIPEPASPRWIRRNSLALIIVPGLAFDGSGGRIGQGGGFYDRMLAVYSGLRVGISLDLQRTDQPLPMLAHDQKMNALVTNQGLWRFDSNTTEQHDTRGIL